MDENAGVIKLTVLGFVWDGADGFSLSVRMAGRDDILYMRFPALIERARTVAKERGITVGDLCDEFNEELRQRERADLIRRGVLFAEFEFDGTSISDALNNP